MSMWPKLSKEVFYNDMEQLFSKVRMQLADREEQNLQENPLEREGDLTPDQIEERAQAPLAEARQGEVFNHRDRTLDLAKMSVNSTSRNGGVTLSRQANNATEVGLSLRSSEWDLVHEDIMGKTKEGLQDSNLDFWKSGVIKN